MPRFAERKERRQGGGRSRSTWIMRSGVWGVTLALEAETLARVSANMFLRSGDLE